jgi:hypothetical protein
MDFEEAEETMEDWLEYLKPVIINTEEPEIPPPPINIPRRLEIVGREHK